MEILNSQTIYLYWIIFKIEKKNHFSTKFSLKNLYLALS